MINKEQFELIIKSIINFNDQVDIWEKTLGCYLYETALIQSSLTLSNYLITTHFNEEGQDWINWWLYEKQGDSKMKAWYENGVEIPTETIDDLWELVKDSRA